MGYLKVYRMMVENAEDEILVCDLIDKTQQVPEEVNTEFILVEGAETPLTLSVIDNDENKFTPIRAHQLEISFLATEDINLNTFAEGADNRWFVELSFLNGTDLNRIFTGYLSLNDLDEDFLDEPNVVTLTATDHLGSLKDVPLVDFNGINPKGKYSIVEYLTMALRGTGMTISLNIAHSLWGDNMVVKDGVDLGWWYTYLDAKTFEDEIGTCLDCYTVLERILGQDSFLTQYRGEWWVVRVEEMDGRGLKVHRFDINGAYVSTTARTIYEKEIYKDGDAFFSGEATYVTYDRPYKSVKEIYTYEYPKEIIDNIDFARGGVFGIINAGENATAYHLEDWTPGVGYGGGAPINSYIKRVFEEGYEKERYVVIPAHPASYQGLTIRSNAIQIVKGDRFTFSIDFKYSAQWSNNVAHIAGIELMGSDGVKYFLLNNGPANNPNSWIVAADQTETGYSTLSYTYPSNGSDKTQWATLSVDAPAAPVAGDLYIYLNNDQYDLEGNFQNLNFNYKPYINGSYQEYKGQYFKTSQPLAQQNDYSAKIEDDVYLSDSPRKLFKGALWAKRIMTILGQEDVSWFLTTKWIDRSNTAFAEWKPYGWWQAFSAWNQYRRTMRLFDVQVQGCYGSDLFGLIHLFKLLDASKHTDNKRFMLLHYELDLRACSWTGFLAEMIDTTKGKTYSEVDNQLEFKFMEDR